MIFPPQLSQFIFIFMFFMFLCFFFVLKTEKLRSTGRYSTGHFNKNEASVLVTVGIPCFSYSVFGFVFAPKKFHVNLVGLCP